MGIKFETKIISAHRTPKRMYQFANSAIKNNIEVIIAGAGGSAHLPGMIAALTTVPVLGVPIESKKLKGLDSLLSIAQMPKGIPVGSLAIGEDGGSGGGLFGLSIFGFGVLGNCQSAEEGQDASDDHPLHERENSSFSVIYQSHSRGFPRIASTISLAPRPRSARGWGHRGFLVRRNRPWR